MSCIIGKRWNRARGRRRRIPPSTTTGREKRRKRAEKGAYNIYHGSYSNLPPQCAQPNCCHSFSVFLGLVMLSWFPSSTTKQLQKGAPLRFPTTRTSIPTTRNAERRNCDKIVRREPVQRTRRSLVTRRKVGNGFLSLSASTATALASSLFSRSRAAKTSEFGYSTKNYKQKASQPLKPILLPILRVQEATVQEANLIKTGAYKDYARADIKLAIQYMLEAYELPQNMDTASTYANQEDYFKAVESYQKVVSYLQSILADYSEKDMSIGNLDDSVKAEIVSRLEKATNEISIFMSYMPKDIVGQAQDFIEEENKLNLAEYQDGQPVNVVELPWKKAT